MDRFRTRRPSASWLGLALVAMPLVAAAHPEIADPVPFTPAPFLAADDGATLAWAGRSAAAELLGGSEAGAYRAVVDARTGVPGLLRVSIPLAAPADPADAAGWRDAVGAFAARHAPAFGLDPRHLALEDRAFAVLLDGRLVVADFAIAPAGIPIEGARFSVRIAAGRVSLIETERLVSVAGLEASPLIEPGAAEAAARQRLADARETTRAAERPPVLTWLPMDDGRGGLLARLAWSFDLPSADSWSSWEARVDARTGEILALRDGALNACPPPARGNQGQAIGGVLPRYPWETEVVRGLPYARARFGPTTLDADLAGVFPYSGQVGDCVLQGIPVRMTCSACSNPTSALAPVDIPTGLADFGTGGPNTTGNGRSVKAERTSFYHGGRIHALARKWLAPAQVPDDIEIIVNFTAGTCNGAYSNRRIYLLQEGGGCVNTGESPSVLQHEWGHALDAHTGPNGNWGEGMSDHMDMLTNRDARMAPGFYIGNTDGLRNADETLVPLRVWPAPECGGEVHCLGEVFAQAGWHLGGLFRADPRFGAETGWHLLEGLFFNSVPQASNIAPSVAGSIYEAYATTLDAMFGDGNVLNGVPLATHLNAAFQHHGMAPASPYPEQAYPCAVAPVAPSLAATVVGRDPTTGRPRVTLTWTAAAVPQDVLRSETGPNYSKLKLGTVPAGTGTFTDTMVDRGATYVYAVLPQLASRCLSNMDTMLSVTVAAGSLSIPAASLDAAGDGVLMPGETVDVVPTIANAATAAATTVVATLEAGSPDVTIVQATSSVATIPASGSAAGSAWRVRLAPGAPCDGLHDMPVTITSDQGCSTDVVTLVVGEQGAAFTPAGLLASDAPPAANGNGLPEPGETIQARLTVTGSGADPAAIARAVTGTLSCADPRVVVTSPNVTFGDVGFGATVTSADAATIVVDGSVRCGERIALSLALAGSNGCWGAIPFELVVAGPLAIVFDDPENDAPGWSVTSTATQGAWQRTDPLPVQVGAQLMPGDDATPDPGRFAWVTEAISETPGVDDVDGGCTTLALQLTTAGLLDPVVRYWRAFGWDGAPPDAGDGFTVDLEDPFTGQRRMVETLTASSAPAIVDADIAALFGNVPASVTIRFAACDGGVDSLVEAVVDEVRVLATTCAAPIPAAALAVTEWRIDDTAGGNGNGFAEPGETIDVRVRLANAGNAAATGIAGTLVLESPVAGVTVTVPGDTWPDLAPGADALDDATFRVALDASVACAERLPLRLDARWSGGSASGTRQVSVGRLIPGATPFALSDDLEGAGALRIARVPVSGTDDWQLGTPAGLGGDPAAAASGAAAWGTDLGVADGRLPRDGAADASSVRRLEVGPLDLRGIGGTRLAFMRWLEVEGVSESARVFVGGAVAWESPPSGVADAAWTPVSLDISALADDRAGVVIAFELTTDADGDLAGWNLDDLAVTGSVLELTCGCTAPLPSPVGGVLRLRRAGDDAILDWSATASDAASFRVTRRVSARVLPVTGSWSVLADTVVPRTLAEADGSSALPLAFYDVRALNACGDQE